MSTAKDFRYLIPQKIFDEITQKHGLMWNIIGYLQIARRILVL